MCMRYVYTLLEALVVFNCIRCIVPSFVHLQLKLAHRNAGQDDDDDVRWATNCYTHIYTLLMIVSN